MVAVTVSDPAGEAGFIPGQVGFRTDVPVRHQSTEVWSAYPGSPAGMQMRATVTLAGPDGGRGVRFINGGLVQQLLVWSYAGYYGDYAAVERDSVLTDRTFLDTANFDFRDDLPYYTPNAEFSGRSARRQDDPDQRQAVFVVSGILQRNVVLRRPPPPCSTVA